MLDSRPLVESDPGGGRLCRFQRRAVGLVVVVVEQAWGLRLRARCRQLPARQAASCAQRAFSTMPLNQNVEFAETRGQVNTTQG